MRIVFRQFEDVWMVLHTHRYEIESLAFEWDLETPRKKPIFDSNYEIPNMVVMNWVGTEYLIGFKICV